MLMLACTPPDFHIYQEVQVSGVPNPPELGTMYQHDQFSQLSMPKLDVLFVVDSSGSMAEEQTKLRNNFPSFVSYFTSGNIDYHIGVVTTDMEAEEGGGRLRVDPFTDINFITIDTVDPIEQFAHLAIVGIQGSGWERPSDTVYYGLTWPIVNRDNRGFLRSDADLFVVVVSDEDDQSTINQNMFISWMLNLKARNTVAYNAITGGVAGCATADSAARTALIVQAMDGLQMSICADNWTTYMDELGLLASSMKTEFYLSAVPEIMYDMPVPKDIEVWVESEDFIYYPEFSYNQVRNSILLSYVPEPLSVIHTIYSIP